ncbi:MAG: lytic transglycosylase domain-containing protein [Aeromicrobium sp.]
MAEHPRARGDLAIAAIAAVVAISVVLACAAVVVAGMSARPVAPVDGDQTRVVTPIGPVAKVVDPKSNGLRAAASWVEATNAKYGIGIVAVQAYGDASLRLRHERPSCHLGWTTLAGIGGIESGHGTNSQAYVQPDGTTSHPILGPALDGTSGMASIRSDAESTNWHGDPTWDHAVGPMQFIPSTWRKWGADGNGDGVANPNNIHDASYAAGLYLCASGGDMRTDSGWSKAVFSYNHSDDYVRSVLNRANQYN